MRSKKIAIGDIHFPFVEKVSLEALYDHLSVEQQIAKICEIVQIGDMYDWFCASRFARTQDLYTPVEEIQLGREMVEDFWKTIKKICPKAKLKQIKGNHDERPFKRIYDKVPELAGVIGREWYDKLYGFPGVKVQDGSRDELILDDVMFLHGYRKHGTHIFI